MNTSRSFIGEEENSVTDDGFAHVTVQEYRRKAVLAEADNVSCLRMKGGNTRLDPRPFTNGKDGGFFVFSTS